MSRTTQGLSVAVMAVALAAGAAKAQQPAAKAQIPAATSQTIAAGQDLGPSYVLGPDDQIVIRAMDAEELSEKPVVIGTTGYINLPTVGRLKAAGLTVEQLAAEIATRLKKYIQEPDVTVSVTDFRSQPVMLLGAVGNPGVVQVRGRKNLFEVLSMAGGVRAEAGNSLKITRRIENGRIPLPDAKDDPTGQFSIAEVSVKEIIDAQSPEKNIEVKPNDVISVPKAEMVYVLGEVQHSGGIVLSERKSMPILEAISLAGGFGPTASPKKAKILRNVAGSPERQEIAVNLSNIMKGKSGDMQLLPNDILVVPSSTGKKIVATAIPTIISAGVTTGIYTGVR